jgi:hypothetical protein
MSFHIPRRPVRTESVASRGWEEADGLPRIPPKAKARQRAYTAPSVEGMVERIASAMLEKEKLQAEIDSVIERSSIYISSRPSTAYGMPDNADDFEPMPSIPALPAAAPSFAERLSSERPPTTSSSTAPIRIPRRETSYEDASAVFHKPPSAAKSHPQPLNSNATGISSASFTHSRRTGQRSNTPEDRPLAPPLPLVLRPPLRKKKSFSRVSSWLGSEGIHHLQRQQHGREMSFDSITNQPMPVTGRDGFYQCVVPTSSNNGNAPAGKGSDGASLSTLSTWDSSQDESDDNARVSEEEEEEEEDRRTVPTSTWSPGSSPATKQGTPTQAFERTAFFAPKLAPATVYEDKQPRASRIGLAA